MKTTRSKLIVNLSIGCFLIIVAVLGYLAPQDRFTAWTKGEPLAFEFCDHEAGQYFTVLDRHGTIITKTSRHVFPGDEIITARGEHYRVVSVEHDVAQARLLGMDQDLQAWSEYFRGLSDDALPVQGGRQTNVAIYHSHTMESYVPNTGEAFTEHGDIIEVGRAFANALRREGLTVFHDTTNHNPHDAQAYQRSRRTALRLMQEKNPTVLIDVHRDGVPDPDFYRRQIAGKTVSQLRLVVGRQNPKHDANADFARRLMARANEKNPGIVKEIFMATGNYNQDLTATSILIEAGTHTNTKMEAINGAALLAEAVPVVLGVGPGPAAPGAGATGWRVAVWVILAVVVGLAVYLVISAGGVPQAREKLQQFFTREFGGRLGNRLKLKQHDDKDKPGESR